MMLDREDVGARLQKASAENQKLTTIAEAHEKLVVAHADVSKRYGLDLFIPYFYYVFISL